MVDWAGFARISAADGVGVGLPVGLVACPPLVGLVWPQAARKTLAAASITRAAWRQAVLPPCTAAKDRIAARAKASHGLAAQLHWIS